MTKRRVYVILTNPLFYETAQLLLKHPDLIWTGASQDINTAREEILRMKPDTILFERTNPDFTKTLLEILDLDTRDFRIIGVSLDTNEISLLHQEHQIVATASDLLQYVLG